jgi:hypothetical protein
MGCHRAAPFLPDAVEQAIDTVRTPSQTVETRQAALDVLASAAADGDGRAQATLEGTLRGDSSEQTRTEAAHAIAGPAGHGNGWALLALHDALTTGDPDARAAASLAIELAGPGAVSLEDDLARTLAAGDPRVVDSAARALAVLGEPGMAALDQALIDPRATVRAAGFVGLQAVDRSIREERQTLAVLVLEKETDDKVGQAGVAALAELAPDQAVEAAQQLLAAPDGVRWGVEVIAEILGAGTGAGADGHAVARPTLPTPALCELIEPVVGPVLAQMSSPDAETQLGATEVAAACPREAGPSLLYVVQTGTVEARVAAAGMLKGHVVDPDVDHLLEKVAMWDPDAGVRAAARDALAASPPPDDLATLMPQ